MTRWIIATVATLGIGCSVVSSFDEYRAGRSDPLPTELTTIDLDGEDAAGERVDVEHDVPAGDGTTTPPTTTARDAASDVPAKPPCVPAPYYRDEDGDGFGAPLKAGDACTPPAGHVAKAGDCNDKDGRVHPGQTSFFGEPFMTAAGPSYDYDCSGTEQEDPTQSKGLCGATCALGYAPQTAKRSLAGASAWCGSSSVVALCERTCALSTVATPLRCR